MKWYRQNSMQSLYVASLLCQLWKYRVLCRSTMSAFVGNRWTNVQDGVVLDDQMPWATVHRVIDPFFEIKNKLHIYIKIIMKTRQIWFRV